MSKNNETLAGKGALKHERVTKIAQVVDLLRRPEG